MRALKTGQPVGQSTKPKRKQESSDEESGTDEEEDDTSDTNTDTEDESWKPSLARMNSSRSICFIRLKGKINKAKYFWRPCKKEEKKKGENLAQGTTYVHGEAQADFAFWATPGILGRLHKGNRLWRP